MVDFPSVRLFSSGFGARFFFNTFVGLLRAFICAGLSSISSSSTKVLPLKFPCTLRVSSLFPANSSSSLINMRNIASYVLIVLEVVFRSCCLNTLDVGPSKPSIVSLRSNNNLSNQSITRSFSLSCLEITKIGLKLDMYECCIRQLCSSYDLLII